MNNEKISKEVQQEITSSSIQSIDYSGEVTVSIVNDKKIILKKVFHNAGKTNLFKFLANCIAGKYEVAQTLQPVKIRLFYNDYTQGIGETDIEKAQYIINNWADYASCIKSKCHFVYYNTTGTVTKTDRNDDDSYSYTATLHFRVPFSYLNVAQEDAKINQICIYADSVSEVKDFSASYLVTKTNEQGKKEMDVINLSEYGDNYTLIVDWAMKVDNQKE